MKAVCLGVSKTPEALVSYAEALNVLDALGHDVSDNWVLTVTDGHFASYDDCNHIERIVKSLAQRAGLTVCSGGLTEWINDAIDRNPVHTCAVPPLAAEPARTGWPKAGEESATFYVPPYDSYNLRVV